MSDNNHDSDPFGGSSPGPLPEEAKKAAFYQLEQQLACYDLNERIARVLMLNNTTGIAQITLTMHYVGTKNAFMFKANCGDVDSTDGPYGSWDSPEGAISKLGAMILAKLEDQRLGLENALAALQGRLAIISPTTKP
jgi:hypothetical protein